VLRPVPIAALIVLVVNDHVLKTVFGDTVTGKLSDAAGLVFVPLLIVAVLELLRARRGKPWPFTRRDLAATTVCVGVALVLAKVASPIATGFGEVGGVMRFPFGGRFAAVQIAHDPTDLWMLPALVIPWFEGAAVVRRRKLEAAIELAARDGESASR